MSTVSNAIIASYSSFNQRRYGTPWVCTMTPAGNTTFRSGSAPTPGTVIRVRRATSLSRTLSSGQVYGYGQKDYRGNGTVKKFAKWDGEKFVPCDKIGQVKEG